VEKSTVICVRFLPDVIEIIKIGQCFTELFKNQKWHVFMNHSVYSISLRNEDRKRWDKAYISTEFTIKCTTMITSVIQTL